MRELKIAVANTRKAKVWTNRTISWEALTQRLSTTQKTVESIEEFLNMKKGEQDEIKDVGGFVMGHLREGRRLNGNVLSRSCVTLDMDFAAPGIMDHVREKLPYKCCVYGTHKYRPEKPRLRQIFPLSRDVSEEEYEPLARMMAKLVGMDYYDDSTYEANRLMYWPSTPSNVEYYFESWDGETADPDAILAMYDDWRDISTWPTSSRQSAVMKQTVKRQADPLMKPGIVGVFCRTFSIREAIERFLPDVYEPSAVEGRYDYIPGEGSAGVVVYDDKFAYSHHATDPAHGKLLNAFDIVRIHKFPDDDQSASFRSMAQFATILDEVMLTASAEKAMEAGEDFSENTEDPAWTKKLEYEPGTLKTKNTLRNITLILENDPNLKSIVFNQLADGMEIRGEVPWKHPAKFWRDQDDAQLISYVDSRYGSFSQRNFDIAVTKVADDRSYHPIREMFELLPLWDGVDRVETILIDYLGASDDDYVRAVTRKALCAAYMRVYHPGIKFDYITVLNGAQGIGKSTLIAKLGMEWFSDSLSLSDMNDKTAAEKLQGYWIHEIGEMAGMKKADLEKVKAFVSRQDDKYRASFGRRVTPHLRQCIFFGTTNSENGYLRDITGNRRFWNVKVAGDGRYKPWNLDDGTIRQIWAEVKVLAEAGETLYLPSGLEEQAKREQRDAMEQDDREGIVREYLETLLPYNWDDMDIYSRRNYIRDGADPTMAEGTVQRNTVTNIEIWCECFGKPKEDLRSADSYSISSIMEKIEGWEKSGKSMKIPIYGKQRYYRRTTFREQPVPVEQSITGLFHGM